MNIPLPHQSFSFEKCSDIYDKCTQKALLPMVPGKGKRIRYHHGGDQSWPHHPSFQQVGATAPAPQQGWAWGPTQDRDTDVGIRGSVFPEESSSSSSSAHFWSLSSHSKAPLVVLPQCFSVPCSVGAGELQRAHPCTTDGQDTRKQRRWGRTFPADSYIQPRRIKTNDLVVWFKAHRPGISEHKSGSFSVLVTITTQSLFYLTNLVHFVALLCESDTMYTSGLYGCVGVCKITYFSSNKVFCYRKRPK